MWIVERALAETGRGLRGDRTAGGRSGSRRQVTLLQAEHLPVIARLLARDAVSPEALRRNLVVSGIDLLTLKNRGFRIGNVLLRGTGPCEPCAKMDATLGPGGYNALRGHGGITAEILLGGWLELGATVQCQADLTPPLPRQGSLFGDGT